ncbi:hypothetical protein [Flavobacterium sp. GP15]|uniref:hypothetical protein n=1 Tax=Flavobacterium sp. GP15 TaxID=2758567 RepID=UPI00165DBC4F|nr:hypothetical protein [Flavobacterium sp. GP15]
MKKHFVITNLPVRLPFQSTILYSFLLYYFQVDSLYWGIFITLYSILWIIAIVVKFNEIKVDLNATKDEEKNIFKQSKFQEKLNELMKTKASE